MRLLIKIVAPYPYFANRKPNFCMGNCNGRGFNDRAPHLEFTALISQGATRLRKRQFARHNERKMTRSSELRRHGNIDRRAPARTRLAMVKDLKMIEVDSSEVSLP
jgi:hypothetical protein